MTSPAVEQIHAALATVNDPEIRRPITDLGMVDSVDIIPAGFVSVRILLTVSGCPMRIPRPPRTPAGMAASAASQRRMRCTQSSGGAVSAASTTGCSFSA